MSTGSPSVRVLCRNLVLIKSDVALQWLIGSPFFPPATVVSTIRCIHYHPSDPLSPDCAREAEDVRALIIKGFHIIGALIVGKDGNMEQIAREAIDSASRMRRCLSDYDGSVESMENPDLIGGVVVDSLNNNGVQFFVSKLGNLGNTEAVESVVYEDEPEKYIWERGCLLLCELQMKLPVYVPANKSGAEKMFLHANEVLVARFKDPQLTYILELLQSSLEKAPHPIIIRGSELNFLIDLSSVKWVDNTVQKPVAKLLPCSYFCSQKLNFPVTSAESADKIQVTIMLNRSVNSPKSAAPFAAYYPALEEVRLSVEEYKLEVICYAAKDLPLTYAVSKLIIPALADQLTTMKKAVLPTFLTQHSQLRPYHFCPPGILHPVTVIYELSYGETEIKQVEVRRSLHQRLGLPSDRPLLRVANALNFLKRTKIAKGSIKKGSLLRDVHNGIPSSGVSGGLVSLVQGSYEYYHYLHEGFDDSGWGCAYRSLQTIISWFRVQHYTSIDVPTHREIQETLVDIGDKDSSFIGSREWIGAIELSYVLDKLLGVTCKIINVRSGAELPEKCRELALHFENQGTPIMIGGGVLAYTLLGVDYNDVTGDCAFLILDPHYTGSDDLKKIINGGWCGWKKAVDSKGKSFFLHEKFYNLLLPQRPSIV
ncbi:hypothetical protein Ancab_035697 [Ancistrocladus abbreviatus]